jgi:diguanylate cyclase (GGDEF)-like protein
MTPVTTRPNPLENRRRLSFRNRILFWILGLLLVLQGTTALFSWTALNDGVQYQMSEALETGKRLFKSEYSSRNEDLRILAETLARDSALQNVIGFRDLNTLKSMLSNHISRVNADIAFVSDYDGLLVGSTTAISDRVHKDTITPLDFRDNKLYERVINNNGDFYQLVIVPITQSGVNVWLSIGFKFNKDLAKHFHDITDLGISFVDANSDRMHVIATTLPEIEQQLPALHNDIQGQRTDEPHFLEKNENIMQVGLVISSTEDSQLMVLIQKHRQGTLDTLTDWWLNLLGLFAVGLLAAGIVAAFIARSVTLPVEALLRLIKKTTSGDYHTLTEHFRQDEIGQLATEFLTMNKAVAEREREILFHAEHDALTGLQTREVFVRSLQNSIDECIDKSNEVLPKFCIGLFNVNGFKDINDTLGHDNGDQLLIQVAQRLVKFFDIESLSRQGADQFLFYKKFDEYNQLNDMHAEVNNIFTEVFAQSGINIALSCTLGVSTYPEHSKEAINLVRLADVAVSTAKAKRMDYALYDQQYDNHSVKRLSLMSDLPHAIADNQLEVYYQPTLNLNKNGHHHVTKAECLVRWHHPAYGFIPPDDFISLAEQSGSIVLLTQWVLKTALAQCQQWRQNGLDIGIAVNIAASDLFRGDLQNNVARLLKHYDIPSEKLTLEVTESEIMEDPKHACQVLSNLKDLGVRLSVDDYGTGYSSLAHLKQLPVHELKIDKSFVLDMARDQDDATIVKSTIELGHTMGLIIVAEGVEDSETLSLLSKLGCDYAQGFHMSKPLPIKELEIWLAKTNYSITQK